VHFSLDGQLGSNDRSRAQGILCWMDLAGVLLRVSGWKKGCIAESVGGIAVTSMFVKVQERANGKSPLRPPERA